MVSNLCFRGLLRDNDGLHNPLIRPAISWGGWHWGGALRFPVLFQTFVFFPEKHGDDDPIYFVDPRCESRCLLSKITPSWMSRWKLGSKVIGSVGCNPNISHL